MKGGRPVLARSPDLARVLTEGLQVFLSTDQRAHLTEGLIGYSFNRIDVAEAFFPIEPCPGKMETEGQTLRTVRTPARTKSQRGDSPRRFGQEIIGFSMV